MTMSAGVGLVWTNPCLPKLESDDPYPLEKAVTPLEASLIASLLSIGILVATLTSGIVAERIGRKKALLIYCVPLVAADVLLVFAKTLYMFYIARFLVGVGVGCVWTVVPLYTAELSKIERRGFTSMLLVVLTNFVQLFAYSYGPFVSISVFSMINLIYSVLFLVLCPLFIPESPYYYAISKRMDKAETALIAIRRTTDVKDELNEMAKSVESAKVKKSEGESWTQIFKSKAILKSLLISCVLGFFNQGTGTVALSLFLQDIFNATKSTIPGFICVIIVTLVQFFTLLVVSEFVDHVNRKLLLYISSFGVILGLIPLAGYFYFQSHDYDMTAFFWLPVLSVVWYNIFFNIGIGPLLFVIAGEIFPTNHLRTYLSGITFSFYICLGFLNSFFPYLVSLLGLPILLFVFIVITCCSFPFIFFFVPETRGKTFYEIQMMLQGTSS